jgi:methylmalonyl-CoA/ethylmalonyl-CoA epimerase
MLGPIGQIAINAHDVDRATAFYKDVLQLRPLFRFGNLSFFDCHGVRLMLSPPEKPEFDHPGSVLYFKVDNIESVHRELVRRGVSFEGEPHLIARMPDHELWMAFFRDTEGTVMALMEEKRGRA